jgi:hypothetical protein
MRHPLLRSLKGEAAKIVPSLDEMPYNNDIFYLRYCLDEELDSNDARVEQ